MRLLDHWGELGAVLILIVGLAISLVVEAAIVSYAVIFFCGIIVGRQYRLNINQKSIIFYIVNIGFLIGYFLGATINRRGNLFVIALCFAIGCYYGNYLIKKKLCK